jgi:putative endopeptidase
MRIAFLLACLATPALAAPLYPPFGVDLTAMDRSVRPQDDFYRFVNGAWMDRSPIPPDRSRYSVGSEVFDRIEKRLRTIMETEAAAVPPVPATIGQKVGAMYAAFMDEDRIEALGTRPIDGALEAIRVAQDRDQVAGLMGRSNYDFGGSFFAPNIDVDLKDNAHYAIYLGQAGLGMPDRDYYLQADFAKERAAYRDYAAKLLVLAGWQDPFAAADKILALETKIAQVSWSKAEQRDPVKMYNPRSVDDLQKLAPGFPWQAYLSGARLGDRTRVVVNEVTAFPKIAAIFAATDIDTLKAWLAFNVADGAAPYLTRNVQRASFEFHDQTLDGQKEMKPRWKRAIAAVSGGDCGATPHNCFGTLNWAVGELYTAHDFTPETKAKVQVLVANLKNAFRARLEKNDWMSPATKAEALKKLDTYTVKVGYPDHPRDYSAVAINAKDLVGDVRNAASADWDFFVNRARGPVDRTNWDMTPQTLDAYNGSLRDIVFPAAILQPPYFDPQADDAVNYGSIGVIIGHEMTHGFDDEGRTIDAAGNLRDWWQPADAAAFKARAAVLGAEFAGFEPLPGLHINPDLTMGENIADLGGVVISLDAYHAALHGKPAPVLNGFTGDQRFFLSYGQVWRGNVRPDAIREQTVSDPHSFNRFRVLGPVEDVDAFYAAFDVKPGDKMYREPAKRAKIW